jgi:hypothetical protein
MYVFEVVGDDGEIRNYVASFILRDGDKLVVSHRGLQVSFPLSHIRDWCSVAA